MNARFSLSCCIAMLLSGISMHSAAHTTVFGFPLGGKLSPALATCPPSREKANAICWIEKPLVSKDGDRTAVVHIPTADRLPLWASQARFEFTLSRDGVLDDIKVSTANAEDKLEILKSISSRFGTPQYNAQPQPGRSSATWNRPDVYIEMRCGDSCQVDFRSPPAQAKREKRSADAQVRDAARPLSP